MPRTHEVVQNEATFMPEFLRARNNLIRSILRYYTVISPNSAIVESVKDFDINARPKSAKVLIYRTLHREGGL